MSAVARPLYMSRDALDITGGLTLQRLMTEVSWMKVREARQECFYARETTTYTYGKGVSAMSYTSTPYHAGVEAIEKSLNSCRDDECPNGYMGVHNGYQGEGVPESLTCTVCGAPVRNSFNVCFLNRYDGKEHQLGWHADDSPGMRHDHPIAVMSFGQAREIWWRPRGQKGVVPLENRQLLGDGSLFIMPPGFQLTHEHRIPKGDRDMSPRVSLTFRRYVP